VTVLWVEDQGVVVWLVVEEDKELVVGEDKEVVVEEWDDVVEEVVEEVAEEVEDVDVVEVLEVSVEKVPSPPADPPNVCAQPVHKSEAASTAKIQACSFM